MKYNGVFGKHSSLASNIFFIVGLLAPFGLRFALLMADVNIVIAKLSGYIALAAYLFFYFYRIIIEKKRKDIIIKNNLKQHLEKKRLQEADYKNLLVIVDSIAMSKLKLNFVILFIMTILTLAIGLLMDYS